MWLRSSWAWAMHSEGWGQSGNQWERCWALLVPNTIIEELWDCEEEGGEQEDWCNGASRWNKRDWKTNSLFLQMSLHWLISATMPIKTTRNYFWSCDVSLRAKQITNEEHDKLNELIKNFKWTIASSKKSFEGGNGPEAAADASEEVSILIMGGKSGKERCTLLKKGGFLRKFSARRGHQTIPCFLGNGKPNCRGGGEPLIVLSHCLLGLQVFKKLEQTHADYHKVSTLAVKTLKQGEELMPMDIITHAWSTHLWRHLLGHWACHTKDP